MNIDMLIDGLLDSYDRFGGINRSEAENFPNRENVIAVLDDLHCLIFPGFKVAEVILPTNIRYITGQRVNNIIALLTKEIQKVVIYARVSSKEQEKEGFSIPAQLELLRNYASVHNMIILKEFEDVETAKCQGRTNFNEMLKFLKNSKEWRFF